MSYFTSNLHSSGDYATEHVFYGLPGADDDREAYRALLESVGGERRIHVVREEWEDSDSDEPTEVELSVIIRPTVGYIKDALEWTGVSPNLSGDDSADYYSDISEFYVTRNGHMVNVRERYYVSVVNVSAVRRAVIESAAKVN